MAENNAENKGEQIVIENTVTLDDAMIEKIRMDLRRLNQETQTEAEFKEKIMHYMNDISRFLEHLHREMRSLALEVGDLNKNVEKMEHPSTVKAWIPALAFIVVSMIAGAGITTVLYMIFG